MDSWQSTNSGSYVPVQFDMSLQEQAGTEAFYGKLINNVGHPSEMMCRLSDSLYFYVQENCPEDRGSQVMEPSKLGWYSAILTGGKREEINIVLEYINALYTTANIPHTYNASGQPALDRRGFLHLLVHDIKCDPISEHVTWDKAIRMFQLRDPMTNSLFPLPIPRTAFPMNPDHEEKKLSDVWQQQMLSDIKRRKEAQGQGQQSTTAGNQIIQGMHQNEESVALRARLEESRHRNAMTAINAIGGYHRRHYYD